MRCADKVAARGGYVAKVLMMSGGRRAHRQLGCVPMGCVCAGVRFHEHPFCLEAAGLCAPRRVVPQSCLRLTLTGQHRLGAKIEEAENEHGVCESSRPPSPP